MNDEMKRELLPIMARHGVNIERESLSGASVSQYLTVRSAATGKTAKIRISDHDLPPTYEALAGAADAEIGPHDRGQSVLAGAETALRSLGVAPDAEMLRALAEEASQQAELIRRRNDPSPEAIAFHDHNARVRAWASDRWRDDNSTRGKKVRKRLREEYDAAARERKAP